MGATTDRYSFEKADHERFHVRLTDSLTALSALLARPGFGEGATTIGAELELNLVDDSGRPALINRAVLADAMDPRIALELDRFNLEFNASPVSLAGRPFTALGNEMRSALTGLEAAARHHRARIAVIGILPTLTRDDLGSDAMTESIRYRALSITMRELRGGEPFRVNIDGDEPLRVDCDDVTLEGANTSLQLHLRVSPREFRQTYNAAQLATPLAVAAGQNSPLFLGHRLWRETRVALFKQAVDSRLSQEQGIARVSFGDEWVQVGAHELFAEVVRSFPPLLPEVSDEDPLLCTARGGVPRLAELRLHSGTVWRWNRAVYDRADGGHLRIELRALPAGPSVTDMLANSAFLLGLTLGLRGDADTIAAEFDFASVHNNFYRAASLGLDAPIAWPGKTEPRPAGELILELLPVARSGLLDNGVAADEADPLLGIIADRVTSRRTGSDWQLAALSALKANGEEEPLVRLLQNYMRLSEAGQPVHLWPEL